MTFDIFFLWNKIGLVCLEHFSLKQKQNEEEKVKKKLFLLSALLLITKEEILANPINWETVSPITSGVSIEENGEIVFLGEGSFNGSQSKGIYGAGFYTPEGGFLEVRLDLITFDSWDLSSGYFDRFLLSTSVDDFFWMNKYSQEILIQFGGFSRRDNNYENFNDYFHFYLEPGTFFSFALEAKMDNCFLSFGNGNFNFIPNQPDHLSASPVPEPATTLLFGTGLIALAGIGRKRRNNPDQSK